jgi:hypothetical protein
VQAAKTRAPTVLTSIAETAPRGSAATVDIFVKFAAASSSAAARASLHRRWFAGRVVYCLFYPEKQMALLVPRTRSRWDRPN